MEPSLVDIIMHEEAMAEVGAGGMLVLGLLALLVVFLFVGSANTIAPEEEEVETVVDVAKNGVAIVLLFLSVPFFAFGFLAIVWVIAG